MPYIPLDDRPQYQEAINTIAELVPSDHMKRAGHMNYIVSLLIEKVYGPPDKMRYADHNEVLGVLSAISLEFYRRKTAPYEDEKIADKLAGDLDLLPDS